MGSNPIRIYRNSFVAQLVRALGRHPRGHRFESGQDYKIPMSYNGYYTSLVWMLYQFNSGHWIYMHSWRNWQDAPDLESGFCGFDSHRVYKCRNGEIGSTHYSQKIEPKGSCGFDSHFLYKCRGLEEKNQLS